MHFDEWVHMHQKVQFARYKKETLTQTIQGTRVFKHIVDILYIDKSHICVQWKNAVTTGIGTLDSVVAVLKG